MVTYPFLHCRPFLIRTPRSQVYSCFKTVRYTPKSFLPILLRQFFSPQMAATAHRQSAKIKEKRPTKSSPPQSSLASFIIAHEIGESSVVRSPVQALFILNRFAYTRYPRSGSSGCLDRLVFGITGGPQDGTNVI